MTKALKIKYEWIHESSIDAKILIDRAKTSPASYKAFVEYMNLIGIKYTINNWWTKKKEEKPWPQTYFRRNKKGVLIEKLGLIVLDKDIALYIDEFNRIMRNDNSKNS